MCDREYISILKFRYRMMLKYGKEIKSEIGILEYYLNKDDKEYNRLKITKILFDNFYEECEKAIKFYKKIIEKEEDME